ncbi:YqgE/AlgH family protein [Chitinispirillales bacterium ANBcel5]|uniref:YqgE/AlgH family protein n=1 Tax=Cellulosispirillum alkaliphilum TaxID=3039283 RepID=UPI002A522EBA|nr:YqgE/AlgH family protein [Chitinispirillales bacterium ANBcel5]
MDQIHSDNRQLFPLEENLKHLKNGAILLSRDALKDPNFEATIVLVCVHSSYGTYGLVLNRPSHMPLTEIFDGLSGCNSHREVFIGGPVNQEELQVLHLTDTPVEDAFEIVPNLYIGGKWNDSSLIIETNPAVVKLFLGFSGWEPEQLEQEIEAGAWDVYRVDLKKLFTQLNDFVAAPVSTLVTKLEQIKIR